MRQDMDEALASCVTLAPDPVSIETAGTSVQSFAMVNGAPFHHLPDDLYIPPHALEVLLDTFEGPLDLLLYLIRRQNLDIVNIPIAKIAHQYIAYIQLMVELNLELAAEYLVMASLLAEIDLLPRIERDIFEVGVDVSTLKNFEPNLPDIQLKEMLLAFQDVLKRVEQLSHHQITKEALSVRERMSTILENLKGADSLLFAQLFTRKEGRQGVVVSFLAILELSKERLIDIVQPEPFAELRVRVASAVSVADS